MEKQFEDNPSCANRQLLFKAQAELNLQLSRKEEFWRQKASLDWFKDGEINTNFFHTVVKDRRNRLRLNKIQNNDGEQVEGSNQIAEKAIQFFKK